MIPIDTYSSLGPSIHHWIVQAAVKRQDKILMDAIFMFHEYHKSIIIPLAVWKNHMNTSWIMGVSVSSWGYPQSSSISNDGIFTYKPSSYGDIPMTMETPKSVIHCLNRPFSIHSPPKIPTYRILHHSITILIRISSCGLGWQWIFHGGFQSRGGSPVHHL